MGLLPNTLELDGIAETGESESEGDEENTLGQSQQEEDQH